MRFALLTGAAALAMAFGARADAAVTTYSSLSAFNAATSGGTTTTETFDSVALPAYGNANLGTGNNTTGYTYADPAGFTIGSTYQLVAEGPTYPNSNNATSNTYGTAAGTIVDANYSNLTITFATAVTAFAINYAAVGRGTSGGPGNYVYLTANDTFNFGLGGTTTTVAYNAANYTTGARFAFFGATSDTAFTTVTISRPTQNTNFDFDSVVFGTAAATASPTPEPATWAMFVGGFGLAGYALRRRRAVPAFG